ncbi:MAG: hypothetical protein IPN86_19235 [Saprospiraceae bacterium]|nr:hypothetical protein [Saprospiraceae bacterium]
MKPSHPISKYPNLGILLFSSIIYVIHFYFFHGGYFGFDDIEYCRLADSILKGSFTHDSLYAHRYASFIPLVFSYLVFGVGDFANFISGFLVFSITILTFLTIARDIKVVNQWIGASLLIFAPQYLMYVEKPMPDIVVALGFLISFGSYILLKFEHAYYRNHAAWFVSGVIIMFLSKETFLIFYPFFGVLMLTDLFRKAYQTFWKQVIIGLSSFIFGYCIYSWYFLGDPFARIHHIFAGQYISACSYDLQPISATLQRIGYQLWLELTRNLYLIPICFVPFLWTSENKKIKFIARSYVALLLLANFMTISYTSYVPLCPDPRHHIYILPIGALVFAYGLSDISKFSLRDIYIALSILGILLFVSVYKSYESTWWLYLPLIAAMIAGYNRQKIAMITVVFFGLLSVFVQNCIYNKKVNYSEQKLLNNYVIHDVPGFKYVITDRVNHDYGMLHSGFDTTLVKFVDYKSLDTFNFKPGISQYLIGNGMTTYLSNTSWESLPEVARTAHEKLPKVYENKSGTVYKIR